MIVRGIDQIRKFVVGQMDSQGISGAGLAAEAEVCAGTVYRLISDDEENQTKKPHFLTIYKIVRALGYVVRIESR